jgi:hypothetical protein
MQQEDKIGWVLAQKDKELAALRAELARVAALNKSYLSELEDYGRTVKRLNGEVEDLTEVANEAENRCAEEWERDCAKALRRLAELTRFEWDQDGDTSDTVREHVELTIRAKDEQVAALAQWKRESTIVESQWDEQAVAKEMDAPLGSSIRANILPWIKGIKQERDALREQVAALAAALVKEIGLKTYFSGRADGLWTCYRCGAIGPKDQIIHKPECTVGTLQGSVAILARVRAEAKAEELERLAKDADDSPDGCWIYRDNLLERAAEIRRGEAPDAK